MQGSMSKKRDPVENALLEVMRPMMVVAALYARRPSLTGRSEWTATTSRMLNDDDQSFPSSALAYLLEALAQIPALYHEQDIIVSGLAAQVPDKAASSAGSFYASSPVRALLNRSLSLRNDVCSQRTQWIASHPGYAFSSTPCTAIPSTQPYPCTVVTHFSSLQVAKYIHALQCSCHLDQPIYPLRLPAPPTLRCRRYCRRIGIRTDIGCRYGYSE